mgnify:FL=1|jgi:hypothetical protein
MILAGTKPSDPLASQQVRIYNVHGKLYDFDVQRYIVLKYVLEIRFLRVTMHTSNNRTLYT